MKVLVVDDEPDFELLIRERLRRDVEEKQYAILFACSAFEALELLEQHKDIYVVLTDINMPEMDGLMFLEKVVAANYLCKVIVVSAYGDMRNIRTAMNRGAFDFITKPVDFKDLRLTIDKTLRQVGELRRALDENRELIAAYDIMARSAEALRQANQLKTELLAIAAHDLKNPLQAVVGFAELIYEKSKSELRNGVPNPAFESIAIMSEKISNSSYRMFSLIQQLLETSAIESGSMKLHKTKTDIGDLLRQAVQQNQANADKKLQTIHFTSSPNLIAEIDADRMREVFDNLISNAIKYSPTGKTIYVEMKKHTGNRRQKTEAINALPSSDSSILISIRDEGQGLTDEDKKKLFGKFQRLSARPTGGENSTGLGLSIVKQLVELHGGWVWAESEGKDQGSTFFVELPATNGFA